MQSNSGGPTRTIKYGFALCSLAFASGAQLVAVLGLRFMTDSLAIPAAVAGSIFALCGTTKADIST